MTQRKRKATTRHAPGRVVQPEGGFSLDLRSADKELKTVTPEK